MDNRQRPPTGPRNHPATTAPRSQQGVPTGPRNLIPIVRPAPPGQHTQSLPPRPPPPTKHELEEQKRKEREEQRILKARKTVAKWRGIQRAEEAKQHKWLGECASSGLSTDVVLGKQIEKLWETTRPSHQDMAVRSGIVRHLQTFFDHRWPGNGLRVAAFGSSVTQLSGSASDLDIVILDPSRPLGAGQPAETAQHVGPEVPMFNGLPEWYNVSTVAKAMQKWARGLGWGRIMAIDANVPIVKFTANNAGGSPVSVDICINNRFGLINSELIKAYADLHPDIVRPLCYAAKHWLKRRDLNDSAGAGGLPSLSSYSIVLLVLQYLQLNNIVPNLQSRQLLDYLEIPAQMQHALPKNASRRSKPGKAPKPPKPFVAGTQYDCTFLDPSNLPSHVKHAEEGGRKVWLNLRKHKKEYENDDVPIYTHWDMDVAVIAGHLPDSKTVGLHLTTDDVCKRTKARRAFLGLCFRGFVQWFAAIEKRDSIFSIRAGQVEKLARPPPSAEGVNVTGKRVQPTPEAKADAAKKAAEPKLAASARDYAQQQGGSAGDSSAVDFPRGNHLARFLAEYAASAAKAGKKPHLPKPLSSHVVKGRYHPSDWWDAHVIVQDPFITDRNTAKNVGPQVAERLQKEFQRAEEIMDSKTFEKLKAGGGGGGGGAGAGNPTQADRAERRDAYADFALLCLPVEYVDALKLLRSMDVDSSDVGGLSSSTTTTPANLSVDDRTDRSHSTDSEAQAQAPTFGRGTRMPDGRWAGVAAQNAVADGEGGGQPKKRRKRRGRR